MVLFPDAIIKQLIGARTLARARCSSVSGWFLCRQLLWRRASDAWRTNGIPSSPNKIPSTLQEGTFLARFLYISDHCSVRSTELNRTPSFSSCWQYGWKQSLGLLCGKLQPLKFCLISDRLSALPSVCVYRRLFLYFRTAPRYLLWEAECTRATAPTASR